MHKYLRAIGFSEFDRDNDLELKKFFDENIKKECLVSSYANKNGRKYGQYDIEVCPHIGISIVAEIDELDNFKGINFYFPYAIGSDYTTIQECTIEKHSDKESFAGVIDDYRLDIALIFYLTNCNNYNNIFLREDINSIKVERIFLSALSTSGKIILPVEKDGTKKADIGFTPTKDIMSYIKSEHELGEILPSNQDNIDDMDDLDDSQIDNMLFDPEEEIPIFQRYLPGSAEDRIHNNEDLFSIVETSLVPFGVECDKYNIVAEILSVDKHINKFTNETLIDMRVETMGIQFNLIINELDLQGDPKPGRRFRGTIWLLGEVEFLINKINKPEPPQEAVL